MASGGPKENVPEPVRRLSKRWSQAFTAVCGGRTRDNGQKLKQRKLCPSGYKEKLLHHEKREEDTQRGCATSLLGCFQDLSG